MDVRCEKCQTEYELDEARLKPGGVTVKCTNCGHMFKIKKGVAAAAPPAAERPRPNTSKQPFGLRDDDPTLATDAAPDRQWLIRLENGEQKSCRELAMLQQWIVAGVVTRNSLISRSGKTWKSLGDIAELAQYFTIADEAKATREAKPTKPPAGTPAGSATMMGLGNANVRPASSGGSIVDDDETRSTGSFKAQRRGITQPPPPPKPMNPANAKTPAMGSNLAGAGATAPPPLPNKPPAVPAKPGVATMVGNMNGPGATVNQRAPSQPAPPPTPPVDAMAKTMAPMMPPTPVAAPTPPPVAAPPKPRPITEPPPPPAAKKSSTWAELPQQPSAKDTNGRSTAVWATAGEKPTDDAAGTNDSRPFGGKINAITDEPAFASSGKMSGKVRVEPSDESSFQTGKVRMVDEDDDAVLPKRQGSRAGIWIALVALLAVGGGAFAAYWFVIRKPAVAVVADAGDGSGSGSAIAAATADAATTITPIAVDGSATPADPLEQPRRALIADVELDLRESIKALDGNTEGDALAMRALLVARLAQDLQDRAGLLTDKSEAEKLRKEAKTIAIDASTSAQLAHKAKPDSAAGNIAFAESLRFANKPAKDIKRYTELARADKDWARDADLTDALTLVRDTKLDDAKALLAKIDDGDNKLETSGDVRARFHRALVEYAQNRPNESKTLVDQILAAQPSHAGARALADRLSTLVAKSDPLPPEVGGKDAGVGTPPDKTPDAAVATAGSNTPPESGGNYDSFMREANKIADSNCVRALELYQKALDAKPDSAEAHTGMGYCFVDAKRYGEAQSKFRTALRYAPKYEPALFGIAESYQYQGRKDDAIEAYKTYLATFPGAQKAIRALERLGVTDAGGTTPPPQTPPPTTPPPTTPPAGDGSGSGT